MGFKELNIPQSCYWICSIFVSNCANIYSASIVSAENHSVVPQCSLDTPLTGLT